MLSRNSCIVIACFQLMGFNGRSSFACVVHFLCLVFILCIFAIRRSWRVLAKCTPMRRPRSHATYTPRGRQPLTRNLCRQRAICRMPRTGQIPLALVRSTGLLECIVTKNADILSLKLRSCLFFALAYRFPQLCRLFTQLSFLFFFQSSLSRP